jgi:hypothetical protein
VYHVWSLKIQEESGGGGSAGITEVFAFNNDALSPPDPELVLREVRPNNVFISLESATRIGTLPIAVENDGGVKQALLTLIRYKP